MRKRNYIFKFYDIEKQLFTNLQNEIEEWKEFGVSFGREKSKTTIVKSYSDSFTFIGADANYLRNILYTRGFNARIKINIYSLDYFEAEKLEYSGFIDLSNAEDSNVFKCPIYAGGFFSALDNNWSEKYSLSPHVVRKLNNRDIALTAFENVEFNGGEYAYKETFGIENNAKVPLTGTSYTMDNAGNQIVDEYFVSFLPIKTKNENKNSKLQYFKDASNAAVEVDTNGVSEKNCFVYAKNKLNAGNFTFSVNNCGNIYFNDTEAYMDSLHNANDIYKINIFCRFGVYLYNEVIGSDTWSPNENLLNASHTSNILTTYKPATMISFRNYTDFDWYYTNEEGSPVTHIKISNINLSHNADSGEFNLIKNNYYDFAWIKDENANSGMYIAFGISELSFLFYDFNNNIVGGSYNKNDLVFEFTDNFEVKYSNENFIINRNKIIHGVKMKYLFTELMDKINVKQYNLNINTEELEAETSGVMLFTNIGLIGTTNLVYENGVYPIISTSISDFLDCLYKVFSLRFFCLYDSNTDTYTLKFVKVKNNYQDVKIDTLLNVNNMVITPDRENLFTSIIAGYDNESDSIFGRFEFNCKNTFKTANTEIESKEFDLVSSYKAGSFDIETFVHSNYGNFEDKTNDGGNIYLLEVFKGKNKVFTINSEAIKKTINCNLTPSTIIANHYKELAGMLYFDKNLTFIATTGNAEFEYHRKENEDVAILEEPYNLPFICTVDVPATVDLIQKIEANPLGYFEFEYFGKAYKGYIAEGTDSLVINPMNEKSSTLKLLLKNDSEI